MFDLIPWRRRVSMPGPLARPTDFDREFDDLIKGFFGDIQVSHGGLFERSFKPAMDISETEDSFTVKVEIPGVDPKELDVNLTGEVLTVKGEKKDEKEENDGNYRRIERSFGRFSRSMTLPCKVQGDEVEANYKDGVLTMKIPKSEDNIKKSVEIKVESK